MSIAITSTEIYTPTVNPCVCGSEDLDHSASFSSDHWEAYSHVRCNRCGLGMSDKVKFGGGFRADLKPVYDKVVRRWNTVMPSPPSDKPAPDARPVWGASKPASNTIPAKAQRVQS